MSSGRTSAFANAASPILVGVVGADSVADILARIAAGRPVGQRELVVQRLAAIVPVQPVHMIFIGEQAWPEAEKHLKSYAGLPVLVVAEAPDALEHGAMLNFLIVHGRVRFEAAPGHAARAGLKFSSRLLGVAERVLKESP